MAPTIGVNLRVTGHCNQGGRKYMEDMFSVAYQQTADELDLEYAYFGIFDGHGGQEAATFAKEHLMKVIVSQSGFWSDKDEDVLRAIKDGFIATHYAMWRNLEKWPRTQAGLPSTSGTTASVAFIRRSNIYIGHVGDSCIVLGYHDPVSGKWKGTALTEDHKPESPMEHKRINLAGGQVVCKAGVPRVVWHRPRLGHQGPLTRSTHIDQIPFLAVARSLGDLWSYNADSDRFVVSPEPDVFVHHIDLSRDKCLIFGTDGLWNMLSPNEAVSIVHRAEGNNKSCTTDGQEQAWINPSKCLVDSAIAKWVESKLRADNTSAVTLLLDPLGPPQCQMDAVAAAATSNAASAASDSDPVPYHIESYKVNEGKCSSKSAGQSNGLAICTWYPHSTSSERMNQQQATGMTTLSAMEELFGKLTEQEREAREAREGREAAPSTSGAEPELDPAVPDMLHDIRLDDQSKNLPRLVPPLVGKPIRRNGKRGRKKKPFEFLKLVQQGSRNKRRHSSLVENPSCEPRSKRRTRSEDQRARDEECKSDSENKSQPVESPEPSQPMRLRSTVPVKTLRSRNINLNQSPEPPAATPTSKHAMDKQTHARSHLKRCKK